MYCILIEGMPAAGKRFSAGGSMVYVDCTDFCSVDYQQISAEIRELISAF